MDSVLANILAKLNAIDKRTAVMEKTSADKLADIEGKVDRCQATLDQIPAVNTRITTVEARITQGEDRLDTLPAAHAGSVESAVKELSTSVAAINAERARMSSELLITGLNFNGQPDMRKLVHSVFRSVIRQLRSKESSGGVGPTPMVSSSGAVSRPPPLVALLSSGSIAHNVILAKARHRKLHSSQLSAELVAEAGTEPPLHPSPININEFLPPDLHNLRHAVEEAAKRKGFSTFVRSGEVFIRRAKDDVDTRISPVDELENFLKGTQQ